MVQLFVIAAPLLSPALFYHFPTSSLLLTQITDIISASPVYSMKDPPCPTPVHFPHLDNLLDCLIVPGAPQM